MSEKSISFEKWRENARREFEDKLKKAGFSRLERCAKLAYEKRLLFCSDGCIGCQYTLFSQIFLYRNGPEWTFFICNGDVLEDDDKIRPDLCILHKGISGYENEECCFEGYAEEFKRKITEVERGLGMVFLSSLDFLEQEKH